MSEQTPAKILKRFTDVIYLFMFMFLVCFWMIWAMEDNHRQQMNLFREIQTQFQEGEDARNVALCGRMKLLEDIGYKNDWTLTELVTKMGLGTEE